MENIKKKRLWILRTTILDTQTQLSAKTFKCNNCQKIGLLTQVCRGYLEDSISEEDEEEREHEEICRMTQINKILPDVTNQQNIGG